MKQFLIACAVIVTLLSCNKDNDELTPQQPQAASVTGLWRGTVGVGGDIAIMQNANGTGRLFMFGPGTNRDTAAALIKLSGNWQLNGHTYKSIFPQNEYVRIKLVGTVTAPTISITGSIESVSPVDSTTTVFWVYRQ
ncbi:MAG TPA: hypothetical protein VHM26_08765 [Chitinophagaceae bacterium]|jgi:hypothetical protein|nr:hypothetical protein [Chitinophagaceae bacterium]